MYLNASNDVRLDAYTLVNIRAGMEWHGIGIYGFARNLLDETTFAHGVAKNGLATGFVQSGEPRTFGVTLRVAP